MQISMDLMSDSVSHLSGNDSVLDASCKAPVVTNDNISEPQPDSQDRELLQKTYRTDIYHNSPELESDVEKDELTPESPGGSSHSSDFSRSLPSSIAQYSSQFGAEEARLRFSLRSSPFKGHLPSSSSLPPFSDDIISRRYTLPESMQDVRGQPYTSGHSSQPSSPQSDSLNSSSLHSFQSPSQQSILDSSYDEDQRNLIPRIKEGLYFCHLCSFSGSTQVDFDQHMTIHFEHICPHCDYKSRTEGRLKRHIKDFHTEDPDGGYGARTMPGRPKVFRCKQCEYSTTEKIDFWTHSRSHIKEDKLLQCPRCPFVTEYKHHLEYHLRNHFGSKPFKCPKCNYACVNKSMLNSHMKSHTNVYQYRCADCTYATKYCHSLKLHLRKYNHKPAAVLNSDGSLPQGVDATASGLSLLAKRGPPRGPRGPRKDKLEPGPSNMLPMPPTSLGPIPGLPGMMSPFWPMLHNQMHGRMPHPLGFSQHLNPSLAGLPPLGLKMEDRKLSPGSSQKTVPLSPFKCNFCSFIGTNREVLTSHVMKVHARENQDLFSMFGLSSESLLDDGKKRMAALGLNLKPGSRTDTSVSGSLDLGNIKKENIDHPLMNMKNIPSEFERMKESPFGHLGSRLMSDSNMKDEGIDILKQMTLKFGSGPVDLKRKQPPTSHAAPAVNVSPSVHMSGLSSSADSPLDLTKPRSPPDLITSQLGDQYRTEEGEHSSGENSVYSNEVSSPQPRKRSRKGKAFKLDTLCMKLQEKQVNMYESEEGSEEDINNMYRPELLPDAEYDAQENGSGYDTNEKDVEEEMKQEMLKNMEEKSQEKDVGTKEEQDMAESENLMDEDKKELKEDMEDAMTDDDKPESEKVALNGNEQEIDPNVTANEKKSPSPLNFGNLSRRKPIPAAIQRGADIAWKILNDPQINDPTQFIKNGSNGHKLEMTPLDKKLWIEAPECTSHLQKTDKGEYECPHCQISFGDCIMYTMHMGYHGYKDPYKCNMCGDTCKDRVEFFLHIARAAHN